MIVGTHIDECKDQLEEVVGNVTAYTNAMKEKLKNKREREVCLYGPFTVSCKTGENVAELKDTLCNIAEKEKLVGKMQPLSYTALGNTLKQMR